MTSEERRPRRLKWLREVQQAYAGSPHGNRETHGLDSDFARRTYVPTGLEAALKAAILARRYRLVVLCGNAGDGKTALLQQLAVLLGCDHARSLGGPLTLHPAGGPRIEMNLDGSSAWDDRSSDAALDDFLAPFADGQAPREDLARLLAINDGRLLEWAAQRQTPLAAILQALLEGRPTSASHIALIHLNRQVLVGRFEPDGALDTGFLDKLVDQLYGGDEAGQIWSKCHGCIGQERCEAFRAARLFGPAALPGVVAEPERRQLARRRLYAALQAVHLRNSLHITIRELRGALAYVLFGTASCDAYCQGKSHPPYWRRAFDATTAHRQGRLLQALGLFDPALEAHARLDRALLWEIRRGFAANLADARRRAYFEWTDAELTQAGGPGARLEVARGRHLDRLRRLPCLSEAERRELLARLCRGLARVVPLPAIARARPGVVPLGLQPRVQTETAFWVEARLDDFHLTADLPAVALPDADDGQRPGLHRQAFLGYRGEQGAEVRLAINADLFHLLLELEQGYRLSAATVDETFAHLALFTEQLIRAQAGEVYAWHPLRDETLYRLTLQSGDSGQRPHQRLIIAPVSPADAGQPPGPGSTPDRPGGVSSA